VLEPVFEEDALPPLELVDAGVIAGEADGPTTTPVPAPSTAPPAGGAMFAAGGEDAGICWTGPGLWRACFFGAFRDGLSFGFALGFTDGRTIGDADRVGAPLDGRLIAGCGAAVGTAGELAVWYAGVWMPPDDVVGAAVVAGWVATGAVATCVAGFEDLATVA
jgi:hypothetical protein